jgi:hypothetical protein
VLYAVRATSRPRSFRYDSSAQSSHRRAAASPVRIPVRNSSVDRAGEPCCHEHNWSPDAGAIGRPSSGAKVADERCTATEPAQRPLVLRLRGFRASRLKRHCRPWMAEPPLRREEEFGRRCRKRRAVADRHVSPSIVVISRIDPRDRNLSRSSVALISRDPWCHGVNTVTGAIRVRDVARHPVLVVCGFGWHAFGRCLWAALTRRRVTFLGLAVRCDE